ncbi:MAG: Clp1/GlmU family protein [Nitrososphaerota archaeon]
MSNLVRRVAGGNTLLVDGPASLKIVSGKASILGCPLKVNRSYLMRPWRRYPVYADSDFEAEIKLAEMGAADTVAENTIRPDWLETISQVGEGSKVVVMGASDTGKTALATLLANRLVKGGGCILACLDPGQSYLSPPTTVGASILGEPIYDPAHAKPAAIIPVGYVSPQQEPYNLLKAVARLAEWAGGSRANSLVVDIDGWVEGEEAENLKSKLVTIIGPTHVIFISKRIESIERWCVDMGCKSFEVEKPDHVLARGQNARRELRAMSYRRFLRNASVRTIPLRWVKAETVHQTKLDPVTYAIQVSSTLEEERGEKGLLSYLAGDNDILYNIGLLQRYNSEKQAVKIYTNMLGPVKKILLGRVLLTPDGDESGFI